MLAIDHFIFPLASLEAIRPHMDSLGFTLAPKALHPFGTANICLFFKDNVYVEFLGLHDRELYAQALSNEHGFIADMEGWRQRNGEEGFSGLAFASQDGYGDHERFQKQGIASGRIGEFSRAFTLPDGSHDTASFRTVHTVLSALPEIVCFTCQRVKVPRVDRSALERHENGVCGVKKIIISAPKPLDLRQDLEKLLDGVPSLAVPDALGFTLSNMPSEVRLLALTPARIREDYGIQAEEGTTPRLVGLVLASEKQEELERRFADSNIACHKQGNTLIHHPLSNKSVFWAFESL